MIDAERWGFFIPALDRTAMAGARITAAVTIPAETLAVAEITNKRSIAWSGRHSRPVVMGPAFAGIEGLTRTPPTLFRAHQNRLRQHRLPESAAADGRCLL